jgi:hypothetical protein
MRAARLPVRATAIVLFATAILAEQIPVRHVEGRIRGFLVLRNLNNDILASGDLVQEAKGNRVTNELTFRFEDGSLHQETSIFSQRRTFQLISYHLVQKGRAFKRAMDLTLNAASGQVVVRYTDDDGKAKSKTERMDLPADIANGLVTTLLGNIDPARPKTTLSMVVGTPEPRLVKLEISPAGEAPFSIGGSGRKGIHYVIKMDIGGISGVIAPLIGKEPPDTHVWMIPGKAPGFLRSEGPLFAGGPTWRIELASPEWPRK